MKHYDVDGKVIDENEVNTTKLMEDHFTIQNYAELLEEGFKNVDEFYEWAVGYKSFHQFKTFEEVIEKEIPANEVSDTLLEAMQNVDIQDILNYLVDLQIIREEE